MKPVDVAILIDSFVRLLYNSERKIFDEIFGEDGPYLWNKFTGTYNGDQEGAFFCYLDKGNQEKLAKAVIEYAKKERGL